MSSGEGIIDLSGGTFHSWRNNFLDIPYSSLTFEDWRETNSSLLEVVWNNWDCYLASNFDFSKYCFMKEKNSNFDYSEDRLEDISTLLMMAGAGEDVASKVISDGSLVNKYRILEQKGCHILEIAVIMQHLVMGDNKSYLEALNRQSKDG